MGWGVLASGGRQTSHCPGCRLGRLYAKPFSEGGGRDYAQGWENLPGIPASLIPLEHGHLLHGLELCSRNRVSVEYPHGLRNKALRDAK